jgi:hypothetical protein
MAALSALAANLIVGSLANIIVVERAKQAGIEGLLEHARCGVPILVSLALTVIWFAAG